MPYSPNVTTTAKVARVDRIRGSISEVITGIVPMVQSAQRNTGFKRSQELTKQRYAQCSWRYGVSRVTAGLSNLEKSRRYRTFTKYLFTITSVYQVESQNPATNKVFNFILVAVENFKIYAWGRKRVVRI